MSEPVTSTPKSPSLVRKKSSKAEKGVQESNYEEFDLLMAKMGERPKTEGKLLGESVRMSGVGVH